MRKNHSVGKIVGFAKADDTVEDIVLARNIEFLFVDENTVAFVSWEYGVVDPFFLNVCGGVVFFLTNGKLQTYEIVFALCYERFTLLG